MKNQLKFTLLFIVINFSGLAIGNFFMDNGPMKDWYINLNKAPWTPPSWVFGVAWTFIMICFSVYLGKLFTTENTLKNRTLFLSQFILNVSWNFIFFNKQLIFLGLINITLLTIILFTYFFTSNLKSYKYFLLPYILWLCIATSLNLYIFAQN